MDSFFKVFKERLDLGKMDRKDSIATEIREKINKIQGKIFECTSWNDLKCSILVQNPIGNNGYNILVIGGKSGKSTKLSPVIINVEEDGTIIVEECGNGEGYNFREYPVGNFLNGSLVLCGESDCMVFENTGLRKFDFIESGRKYASLIKLNESHLWITGGNTYPWQEKSSTEIININGAQMGINLPFTVYNHCMLKFSQNKALLIGGNQNETTRSQKTWIIDLVDFNFTEGPSLIKGRQRHVCGKLNDEFGNEIIVVVGGKYENSVEVLNATLIDEWKLG